MSDFDRNVNAAGKLELHQRIHSLGSRAVDVDETLERAKLELLAGFLVDESRTVDSEDALVRGQRNRTADNSTGGFHRLYDLFCRLVDKIVIV